MQLLGNFFAKSSRVGGQPVFIEVYQDAYNNRKIWLVKQSGNHYYYKQMIDAINPSCYLQGRLVAVFDSGNVNNTNWIKTTKRQLREIGILE